MPNCSRLAYLVTPNLDEAEVLTGEPVRTVDQMVEAARQIHGMGARNVMLTGGHLDGARVVDVFFDGTSIFRLVGDRIDDRNSRGTGCVLSAAVTAHLARRIDLESAVSRAQGIDPPRNREGPPPGTRFRTLRSRRDRPLITARGRTLQGSRYERHWAVCEAPRRSRCPTSIEEGQRGRWPDAAVTRRAQGGSGHRLCRSSVTR